MKTVTGLLERVRAAGGALEARDDQLRVQASEPLPPDLVDALRVHKAQLIHHLKHAQRDGVPDSAVVAPLIDEAKAHKAELIEAPDVSHAIQAAIVGAQTWEDLSSLCEDIDAAYRAGDIDTEVADALTNLVRQRAREVPEDDAAFLEMPLDKLAQSGIYREIHSKVLDQRVIFAADNAEVPEDTPLIVYRAAEMREINGASPEMLRAAHEVKKAFDGEVVGPDEDETRIPSSDLLENPRDNNTCSACGQSRWWTKQCGQRMCAVCHPGPSGTHVDDIK